MLFFGHIGITAGVARAGDIFLSAADSGRSQFNGWQGRIKRLIGNVDYRLVLFGSLLPDIIDKPVFLLFGGASLSGRDYAHSLLFNLLLIIGGLILARYERRGLLTVSLASLTHLILDQIWNNPVTLFWPLLGPLLAGEPASWLSEIVHGMFNSPVAYIPEIIGLAIVLLFAYRLMKKKDVNSFFKEGTLR